VNALGGLAVGVQDNRLNTGPGIGSDRKEIINPFSRFRILFRGHRNPQPLGAVLNLETLDDNMAQKSDVNKRPKVSGRKHSHIHFCNQWIAGHVTGWTVSHGLPPDEF